MSTPAPAPAKKAKLGLHHSGSGSATLERTKQVLPNRENLLQLHLHEFENFTIQNKMKVNVSKTKVMKFTNTLTQDFPLEVSFSDNQNLEVIKSIKLLGIQISENLKWDQNTDYICKKAKTKIFLLRNMKKVA